MYANRSGLSIIDLDQSLPILRRTASLVRDVVKDDGVVLFVGSKTGHARCLERVKDRMGDNGFTSTKWVPGLLTNSETLCVNQVRIDAQCLMTASVLGPWRTARTLRTW